VPRQARPDVCVCPSMARARHERAQTHAALYAEANVTMQSMSHVTRHTSHVTRHTSHLTRHTSHVTRHTSAVAPLHAAPPQLVHAGITAGGLRAQPVGSRQERIAAARVTRLPQVDRACESAGVDMSELEQVSAAITGAATSVMT